MRSLLAAIPFAMITVLCWGVYGPVLHHGKTMMGGSSLRQLICVGVAYFFIAVVVPIAILRISGEQGKWTIRGTIWSLLAGVCGVCGALGIIVSLNSGGSPVYVMPLVFGCAPVVNTIVSMWITRAFRQANQAFYVGILLVALGAAGVLFFKPGPVAESIWNLSLHNLALIFGSIGLTAFCWGCYGSVLHSGQAAMAGSRLRPLLCVGLAYFAIAVLVPMSALAAQPAVEPWTWNGAMWSLAGGAAGALGALGIILSFTFGGKPIFVMPLVFGGAPLVTTAVSIVENQSFNLPLLFYVSLVTVIAGAVTVLVFAPKPGKKPEKPPKVLPAKAAPGKSAPQLKDSDVAAKP